MQDSDLGSQAQSQVLQPAGWAAPRGYSHGIVARGRLIFVAGQIGWNAAGELAADDFVGQVRQALSNVLAVLAVDGAGPEHLTRLTWYVTDRGEYLASRKEVGQVYRELIGRHYPAMSVVQVVALLEAGAKVEIEATAVVPDAEGRGGVSSGR